jgi:hypothetical protein
MKIEASKVSLEASHEYDYQRLMESEHTFSFSGILEEMEAASPPEATAPANTKDELLSRVQLLLQQLVNTIMQALSGEKCRCGVDDIAELKQNLPQGADATAQGGVRQMAVGGGASRAREFNWQSTTIEHITEREQTRVNANGLVKTADGRDIAFKLDLAMCRDYSCTREAKESGKIVFKDPLVINFAGKAAELSDKRFNFDLDADGTAESLPNLVRGSGFLALDADHDGRINNGRELFGATGEHAGDGFADLARLDSDQNGWIDEADPAYAALGVWFPDGKITPLKEAGVGALNLASAHTPFALKDENNVSRGQIWRTGVYLAEDGHVGSLQQIDLGVAQAGPTATTVA